MKTEFALNVKKAYSLIAQLVKKALKIEDSLTFSLKIGL